MSDKRFAEVGYVDDWFEFVFWPGYHPQRGDVIYDNTGTAIAKITSWGRAQIQPGAEIELNLVLYGDVSDSDWQIAGTLAVPLGDTLGRRKREPVIVGRNAKCGNEVER